MYTDSYHSFSCLYYSIQKYLPRTLTKDPPQLHTLAKVAWSWDEYIGNLNNKDQVDLVDVDPIWSNQLDSLYWYLDLAEWSKITAINSLVQKGVLLIDYCIQLYDLCNEMTSPGFTKHGDLGGETSQNDPNSSWRILLLHLNMMAVKLNIIMECCFPGLWLTHSEFLTFATPIGANDLTVSCLVNTEQKIAGRIHWGWGVQTICLIILGDSLYHFYWTALSYV